MSFAGLLNQPVTIERRGPTSTDDYGNEVAGTTSSTTADAYVEQTAATEVIVDRETYVTDWLVTLPASSELDASDRIVFDGHTLQVVGAPLRAWNPRLRAVHHVECRCVEVTG